MAERFSSDLLFIVIALLIAAILGFLIGYYLRKRKAAGDTKSAESSQADESENILTASADTHEIIEKVNYETAVAEEIMETEIGLNDLQIIEGVGPKIEKLLRREIYYDRVKISRVPVRLTSNPPAVHIPAACKCSVRTIKLSGCRYRQGGQVPHLQSSRRRIRHRNP